MSGQTGTIGWTIDQWVSAQRAASPEAGLKSLVDLAASLPESPEWIYRASTFDIKKQWALLDHAARDSLALYGVPFAVKDNIDVKEFPTTAACPAYRYVAPDDAFIVATLRSHGAIVVGKTNLDQFATGLVGTRSPYGIPTSVFSDKHVSGGSSSGSAVAVGKGVVPFSLGTDTAGSGRVPAALNNLIGLKPSLGAWSTTGVVPACRSLDTATVFTLNLRDAQTIFALTTAYDELQAYSRRFPTHPLTSFGRRPILGVPANLEFFGDEENQALFKAAVQKLIDAGIEVQEVDLSDLFRLAKLLYEGPWVAERFHAIRELMDKPELLDPTVYGVIKTAEGITAVDAFDAEYLRNEIKKRIRATTKHLDGFVMPTCPLNPLVADVLAEPIAINSKQGTYTNFVNLGDFSALAIPAGFRKDGLPVGLTFMSEAFNDYALLDLAQRFLPSGRLLGNTGVHEGDNAPDALLSPPPGVSPSTIKLAVVGAHLSGMVLNWQLRKVEATLIEATETSPNYELYALQTTPPKPGILRVASGGTAIKVEVWDVPIKRFGEFVAMVPAPLGIGSLELATGEYVKGFIVESSAIEAGAKNITSYGGWRRYISEGVNSGKPFETVLVANRGEIAVRIIRTLKRLGITTVAVFSEPDRYAQHVLDADVAVDLHGTTASETYLSVRKIIDACKQTAAQAVIPGYGFLSENATFADSCGAEGIVFIGPSGDAMRKLGLKHSAREIAEKAGVPLVPGSGLVESVEEAREIANKLGYPVMIKSTAGGGGIGLQRVDNDAELNKAFFTVKHQGQAYFGDSGVFLETFVENARHVEVQVFGDGRGDAIALGERDCSLQRRNQKIIEETPAPDIVNETRAAIRKSARDLAASMNYKCAGTVEYIYDSARNKFYFLEVNARLQVEHPITEMVTGLDLVEWMVLVAADRPPSFKQEIKVRGASMEARLYAENPVRDFLPSPGQITDIKFPEWARVDGWARKGTVISSEYDPTVAKIIVYGKDRKEALAKLNQALAETVVSGVVTNLDYLRSVASSQMFADAKMYTKVLDSYVYQPHSIEIAAPGASTTIQDYPGRALLWHIGVPPSGPMDDYGFRAANLIVGNHERAPALEATLNGPTILFHHDSVVGVTGGVAPVSVDGQAAPMWAPIFIKAGQKLAVGKLSSGCRAYIAIRGGLDVPEYLGSRSTFAQGKIGGHNGRVLKFGDVIPLGQPELAGCALPAPIAEPSPFPKELIPEYTNTWEIGVTCGPHGAPDFFKPAFLDTFFATDWKIHYNSNRFGVRLIGPKPEWARSDGGEAGLHPSNAHDYVYSLGAINFTGDDPVILACDGPSLGGFVCAVVIVQAELWKVGQVKPGDHVRFVPITAKRALQIKDAMDQRLEGKLVPVPELKVTREEPVLYSQPESKDGPKLAYRQAGDRYMLIEYGENLMDLNLRYRVHRLMEMTLGSIKGVLEMSPGVRSVHLEYDPKVISQAELLEKMVANERLIEWTPKWKVPSRVLRLPMAFEDELTLSAVTRYQETIRSEAPWLPNNVDFITEVNGLKDRNAVRDMMYSARFLVMGLGDVYLGAPCAVPLDPRQRFLGTKYNPSRSWTPNGTVGLGGMYMCIYTMESPGGYQLIGRTVPIWDKLCLNKYTSNDEPWLLKNFDQIEYYPVSEEDLAKLTIEVEQGTFQMNIEDSYFDNSEYEQFLENNKESINKHVVSLNEQQESFAQLIGASNSQLASTAVEVNTDDFSETAELIYAEITGRFWKAVASEGDLVEQSSPVVILEAMKTEMTVNAPVAGKVVKIIHKNGDMVEAGDLVAVIEP